MLCCRAMRRAQVIATGMTGLDAEPVPIPLDRSEGAVGAREGGVRKVRQHTPKRGLAAAVDVDVVDAVATVMRRYQPLDPGMHRFFVDMSTGARIVDSPIRYDDSRANSVIV